MTTTQPSIADMFIASAEKTLGLGKTLIAEIPAEKFALKPHPTMNHPAFCIGHLSLYPNRVLSMIGRDDAIVEKAGYSDIFEAGNECVEQDGRYPAKDEIIAYYTERHEATFEALRNIGDEIFAREMPLEGRIREMFPTIGLGVNFLLNNHHMFHLGQVSAWRRAVGLGQAM